MPRRARVESSTGIYHVIIRGNNKEWIFREEVYKLKIRHLILAQEDLKLIDLYAWCIMDNHVHIVLRAEKENMFRAMWNINRLFARHYNYKESKVGHVFENRYKSEPVEDEKYLKQVIRYVHNNPVKANIKKQLGHYKWSSYRGYIEGMYELKNVNILKVCFNNDIEAFVKYHTMEDEEEYLEIIEDLQIQRDERAQRIISEYCNKYNATSISGIHKQVELQEQIIKELIVKSKLPLRRLGKMTGMTYSSIQSIYQKFNGK
jgi:REP element-mobilizing transposase RayT